MNTFKSHGKLLLSAEYVVLDGALALALPTKYGQDLTVEPIDSKEIIWESFDHEGRIWYQDRFNISQLNSGKDIDNDFTKRLVQILKAARDINPHFLNDPGGFKLSTHLDFPKKWGLGSSSTLINNIAKWSEVDAYTLLENTFGGSGYDIACAESDSPILYQLQGNDRFIKPVAFDPVFKSKLYFVYLNRKQNSRDGIAHYHANKTNKESIIAKINSITRDLLSCDDLLEFEEQLNHHEDLIAAITRQTPIKKRFFKDYKGSIKSLGAWGGDFILATSQTDPRAYFESKGFDTVINYSDIIL